MATKSGRSKTGTRTQSGRTTKSAKVPAKRSKAGAKRGSAKKAPSKEGGRRSKAAGEPKFYLIFKTMSPPDLYVVAVYDKDKVTSKNKACLESNYRNVPTTVTAYLVKRAMTSRSGPADRRTMMTTMIDPPGHPRCNAKDALAGDPPHGSAIGDIGAFRAQRGRARANASRECHRAGLCRAPRLHGGSAQ